MTRTRGPVCGEDLGEQWIDSGTNARTRHVPRQTVGIEEQSEYERELLLDMTQMLLDLSGIPDPTPVSDGSNVMISLGRGDWSGAGLSAISLIPFLGDLAKLGKVSRWIKSVQKAVDYARRNSSFAIKVRPLFEKLANALNGIPLESLPVQLRGQIRALRKKLNQVVGNTGVAAKSADQWASLAKSFGKIIDKLDLKPPAGKGVLWSRIGPERAKTLARGKGMETLESMLEKPTNQKIWNEAYEKVFGKYDNGWSPEKKEASKQIWEELSRKYVQGLEGPVFGFTDLESLSKAIKSAGGKESELPVLTAELMEIADLIESNSKITQVALYSVKGNQIVDVVTMSRNMVLKAKGLSH